MFWFFDHKTCGILAPQPGIKLTLLALGGEVLTTGLPEKSHIHPLDLSTNVCEAIFNPLTPGLNWCYFCMADCFYLYFNTQ